MLKIYGGVVVYGIVIGTYVYLAYKLFQLIKFVVKKEEKNND